VSCHNWQPFQKHFFINTLIIEITFFSSCII
jgi:hypothetical protein